MRYVRLFWRLLRYRVAVMLVLFLLLGAASRGDLATHAAALAIAALALACSYVSATSSNDLADEQIDAINHAGHKGRLLVSGEATRADLKRLFLLASAAALVLAATLGPIPTAIMALSVLINIAYSLPPLRLSYRTMFAPAFLGVGYVALPFSLGSVVVSGRLSPSVVLMLACYFLFIGRIVLKDFRDRAGDAKYGKPTFLLVYGKPATCAISAAAVVVGAVLLWAAHPVSPIWLLLAPSALLAVVLLQVFRLWRAPIHAEQPIIGTGAKLGNAALIILLGLMFLGRAGATLDQRLVFAIALLMITLYSYNSLQKAPQAAVNAYRG
jgi:4-hydroxybenzoate polyprenyltransferase